METQSLVTHTCIYNLTKFARFHKAQSGDMCKVDHQACPMSILSETHL